MFDISIFEIIFFVALGGLFPLATLIIFISSLISYFLNRRTRAFEKSKKLAKWGLILLAIQIAVWILFAGFNFISDYLEKRDCEVAGFPNTYEPDPLGSYLDGLRQTAIGDVASEFNNLEEATGWEPVLAGTYELCEHGQYNWKIKSKNLSSCKLREVRFYQLDESIDLFRPELLRLAEVVSKNGWVSRENQDRLMMENHFYDSYAAEDGFVRTLTDWDYNKDESLSLGAGYFLPSGYVEKGWQLSQNTLAIIQEVGVGEAGYSWYETKENSIKESELEDLIQSGGRLFHISITKRYFYTPRTEENQRCVKHFN